MATSMFPNFAPTNRPKRAVTYGKASRSLKPPKLLRSSLENAATPESPAQTSQLHKSETKSVGALKSSLRSNGKLVERENSDIFGVPSEDELNIRPTKPFTKPTGNHRLPEQRSFESDAPTLVERVVKTVQLTNGPNVLPISATTTKKADRPVAPPQPQQRHLSSSENETLSHSERDENVELTGNAKPNASKRPPVPQSQPTAKPIARANTYALSTNKTTRVSKPRSIVIPTSNRANTKKDSDVFDVPSSDEEQKKAGHNASNTTRRKNVKKTIDFGSLVISSSKKVIAESDDSNSSRKRKCHGSVSSTTTAKSIIEEQDDPTLSHGRKSQKKMDGTSPKHMKIDKLSTGPLLKVQPPTTKINKPARTRLRNLPVPTKPSISKAQSSPAALGDMISKPKALKSSSPLLEALEEALEDETMYEIPGSATIPVESPRSAMGGSVTPSQKALFSSLLGESPSDSNPMPKISTLQLTNRKSRSLLGALARSSSDMANGAKNHKTRLIDTIKRADTSSDDEDNEELESDQSDTYSATYAVNHLSEPKILRSQSPAMKSSDDMDLGVNEIDNSQSLQFSSRLEIRSKHTYAKSRSYLQEANFEDELLLTMDIDENLTFGSQNADQTEDEEDTTSQIQPRHELKRRGQQTAFQWETESLVNDISIKTSNSVRRSTMLEVCTKMADETFTAQLLDSSMAGRFFHNISSSVEVMFDFSAAVAVFFIFQIEPSGIVVQQMYDAGIIANLMKLLRLETDIVRIAKERKTNLSKIAQESVGNLRTLVLESPVWGSQIPEQLSPQVVALKALEMLVLGLRKAGSNATILEQEDILKLLEIITAPAGRISVSTSSSQIRCILDMTLSILESTTVTMQKQPIWSPQILESLAGLTPVFFQPEETSLTMLAVKLCMNLTNNKPQACRWFAVPDFVQPLGLSIIHKFQQLGHDLGQEQRTPILETLILSLGALINLAELNDQARLNMDDHKEMIEKLLKIFLEGSERAAQADSVEESQTGVAVGYLSVLLGNLCLNRRIRTKIRALLPEQRLDILIEKIREFVKFHESVDGTAKEFESEEGKNTWQNYTARLMQVVTKLEGKERQ